MRETIKDFYGKIFSHGNILSSLIRENNID